MAFILLLANQDSSISPTIPRFLEVCKYQEIGEGKLNDCMNSLLKVKETLGPYMITNMNRIARQGIAATISRVQKLLNVNIIALFEDDVKIHGRKGIHFSVYVLNIFSIEEMNRLWKHATTIAPPVAWRKSASNSIKKRKKIAIRSSSPSPKEEKESLPSPLALPPPASSDVLVQGV